MADLKAVYAHFADQVKRGEALGPDIAILKVLSTETNQRITEFMLEASGDLGMIASAQSRSGNVNALTPFLIARSVSIGAGTNEVLRNVVAKQVLGLPS